MKKVFLYLDDDVFAPGGYRDPEVYYPLIGAQEILDLMREYEVVKFTTVEDSMSYIEANGCPDFISFDNDLTVKLEGVDLAKWIVEKDMDAPGFIPEGFQFFVHSQNTQAKKTIYSYLNQYLEFSQKAKSSDMSEIGARNLSPKF